MENSKCLCVMADDFGMHPAVNEGIAKAFTDGLLTDTNLMAPCPAFKEAAVLAKKHEIPVGLHATFTCDWDLYKWDPITDATSFRDAGGHLKTSVKEAWKDADEEEAYQELLAQYQAVETEGIAMTHVGEHMGTDRELRKFARTMARVGKEKGLPHKSYPKMPPGMMQGFAFGSGYNSARWTDYEESKRNLVAYLENLTPGYHTWVTHPAADHPSMDEICSRDWPVRDYARTFRAIDLQLLLDAEIAELLEKKNIKPVPILDCPVTTVAGPE